ncbi:MAG: MFS transporter [Planctomycetales bacterium]
MTEHVPRLDDRPLSRNLSFWGMTATQFLGAFNDNLFKQVALLMCIDYERLHQTESYQPYAQALFALPFVLFSGLAGYLADRFSKRRIVVMCKVAEVGIMMLGVAAVASGHLWMVLLVLSLMGTHSAYFGPSKYGILPELVPSRELSQANSLFLMTSFLAIILGTAAAGFLKGFLEEGQGLARWAFPAVALLGTGTSLFVRHTAAARPGLPFHLSEMLVDRPTARMFLSDRPLLFALAAYSLFWLVGGVVLPNVNDVGKKQLGIDDATTSATTACLALGIAAGCGMAGVISGKRIDFRLVRIGSWGMIGSLVLLSVTGVLNVGAESKLWCLRALLVAAGACAGLFTVPLQAFLQSRPAADQKGRVMGAMNLATWIAILLSAVVYAAIDRVCATLGVSISWGFAATGCLMLPIALFYRPKSLP